MSLDMAWLALWCVPWLAGLQEALTNGDARLLLLLQSRMSSHLTACSFVDSNHSKRL